MTEREIFFEAIEITSADARAAYLQGACGKDVTLRRKVEQLLQEHFANDSLLAKPALDGPPTLFDSTPVTEGPGAQIGRYKLLQKLGEGGFGVVYMAEQKEPVKRRVALKIIKLGMDTQQVVARFEAERQALAMMDHPNIAKVLDAGATDTGRPYFVMELVKGVPITRYCDDNNLTTQERLELFISVCQAIQHAHQKGIIHRDIKPSNVMVTLHDGVPVPKVIDFGIAKATQQQLTEKTIFTQFSQFIGTPAYMSPEQAELSGLDIDTRSDIYSLGVLLYELLVGRTPLDGKELMSGGYDEIRRRIKEEEPAKPSTRVNTLEGSEKTTVARHRKVGPDQLSSELRGDLDWIVMKALEKDRTRRYETANDFALDIKRFLKNEPVAAVAPSSGYLLKKYAQRHRGALIVAAAIAVLLVLGVTVSTWQAVRATRAQQAAEKAQAAELKQKLLAQEKQKEAEEQRQRAEDSERSGQRLLYAANMNLAQHAWEQNNAGRVRQLLAETAAYPERGFEWFYWQRLMHLDIRTLRGHRDGISSVAISPDGQRIVTGSKDHTAKVWDTASGKELFTFKKHLDAIISVAVSPDGRWVVTGSEYGTAKVWEAAGGKELHNLKGHADAVTAVAVSPDGRWVVTASNDQTAKVWDAASGDELCTFKGHDAAIRSVAFSPDSQRIVTGSADKLAKVWEAATCHELFTLPGHKDRIAAVAFSPDGRRIVTGSWDQTVGVWEAATGKGLHTFKGHSGNIMSLAFSPDSQRIVTGGLDQTAKVWDVASGTNLLTLKGHGDWINSVAFSPDGKWIVTASNDQTAKIWDATSGKEELTFKGHTDWVRAVAFSPDSQRIVSGCADQTAKVWEAASGQELLTLRGHIVGTKTVSWVTLAGVRGVAFSPDGLRIVTASQDQTAKLWEAASGKELRTFTGHSKGIWTVAFSPDGQRIVTGSQDNTAKVWETATGKNLFTLEDDGGAGEAAFSPDGRWIITAGRAGTARLWEAATGKELHTFKGHSGNIMSLAFSPDSQRIVTGGLDQTAKVWDVASGTNLLTLKGHSSFFRTVAFSPDGQRIVSGSGDATAKVWEATTGKELLTLKGHSDGLLAVAFSPEGQRIVTGSIDKTAKVWEAATPQQVAAWQQEEKAAAERLALLDREETAAAEHAKALRAQDPGAIKQWLVLAPIAFAGGNPVVALDQVQIPNEARLRPQAGQHVTVGPVERVWTALRQDDYEIDFNKWLGKVTENSVAYAVTYIQSDTAQTNLVMKVGCDDQAKIFLNEKEIYRHLVGRAWVADQDAVLGVELKAGLNVLVFKVVNGDEGWGGSVRFLDANDQPVNGIKVTLDPDAAK